MSHTRPLLPRPLHTHDAGLAEGNGAGGGRYPGRRKIERISQACEICRRKKVKCDGLRPVCSPCSSRNASCEYGSSTGQSKLEIANSRLEAYGALFASLKNSSLSEVDALLEQMRATDDILSLAQLEITDSVPSRASASDAALDNSVPEGRELNQVNEEQLQDSAPISPILHSSLQNLQGDVLLHLEIPPAEITKGAVDFFFDSSSRLFHVFSPKFLDHSFTCIYQGSTGVAHVERMTAIACISATAAVGCQYSNGDFDEATEKAFYNASRHCLDNVVEHSPLDAIGVCSLLAMYNIMGKGTVALTYVEIGLSMARRHGLYDKKCPYPNMSPAQWIEYRKTWRALIFFSSWLGATLGYVSGNDSLLDVKLSEMNVDNSQNTEDIVQAELTKISLLKVTVLRLHMAFKDLTELTAESILKDLTNWHLQLPLQMQLGNIESIGLSVGLRRTIYYAHLLHLGAVLLVYRLIAYKHLRPPLLSHPLDTTASIRVHRLGSDGIAAARKSALILEQLMADHGVFRRCWLVMFQSYTSCLALLHSVVQEQLQNSPREQWEENFRLASRCLNVLEHCGQMDRIASTFHRTLVGYYNKVGDYTGPATSCPLVQGELATPQAMPQFAGFHPRTYLQEASASGDAQRVNLAKDLLRMLCVPFGDADSRDQSEKLARTPGWHPDPTCYEHPQLIERLDCDLEKEVRLYDTGTESLLSRMRGERTGPDPARFLGNCEPHGWSLGGFSATYDVSRHSGS